MRTIYTTQIKATGIDDHFYDFHTKFNVFQNKFCKVLKLFQKNFLYFSIKDPLGNHFYVVGYVNHSHNSNNDHSSSQEIFEKYL